MNHWIKDFRTHYKMTQDALANILGVSRRTVNRWETGRSRPPRDLIERLTLWQRYQKIQKPRLHGQKSRG